MNTPKKVLIVTKTLIGDHDGASLSLRNWLHGAFPNHIAQIYSGGMEAGNSLFPAYRLAPEDRRFGETFSLLKRSAQSADATHERAVTGARHVGSHGVVAETIRRLGKYVLDLGLWEIIFKPRLSPNLRKFIEEFGPDLIIAQGFDLGFTWLPVEIHEQFGVPITTIIVDDWEPYLYPRAPRLFGMRGVVRCAFLQLLGKSERRYCISPQMAREYEQRYGLTFGALMQVDHRPLLNDGQAKRLDPSRFVVAYSGSLGLKRWEGLRDLADALTLLDDKGISGELRVYASFLPAEAAPLQQHPKVKLFGNLADAEVLAVLAKADMVFLPESFDEDIRKYIRLSVSTKAHLYMMTGAIPLVYGPREIGTVRYAAEEGWGVVVDEPGVDGLVSAIRRIVDDSDLRARLVAASRAVFIRNHAPATSQSLEPCPRAGRT